MCRCARISPALALAVIVAEDGRFCSHHGVDFAEIRDAIADADDLDDVRGGSTITQQVAKNLFLWPGRSYVRKALEFPLALWIDLVLPKRGFWKFTSTSRNGARTANSASRPAAAVPLVSRPAISPATRPRCWRPCCPIR